MHGLSPPPSSSAPTSLPCDRFVPLVPERHSVTGADLLVVLPEPGAAGDHSAGHAGAAATVPGMEHDDQEQTRGRSLDH